MKFKEFIYFLGWASGLLGAMLMLCGVIGFFRGGPFLMVHSFYNWFYVANSFLFLGTFLVLATFYAKYSDEKEKNG